MVYIYIFGLVISVLGMIYEKLDDKFNVYRFLVFGLIIYIMINCNDRLVDLFNYSNTYHNLLSKTYTDYADIGYYFFQRVAIGCGLDFIQFRFLLFFISFLLIHTVLKKYVKNISFFALQYLLFFSVMDAEQLRNFLAFSIVIFAIPFLLEDSFSSLIKYTICILLAMTIHIMSVVYFLFILVKVNNRIRGVLLKLIPIYLLVMFFAARHGGLIQNVLNVFASISNEQIAFKLSTYTSTSSNYGFLLPSAIYLGYTFFVLYLNRIGSNIVSVNRYVYKKFPTIKIKTINKDISNFFILIKTLNLIGCLLIPLCMINLTFYRLLRNITMLDLILITSNYNNTTKYKDKFKMVIFALLLIFGWQIWDFAIYQDWDTIIQYFLHI